MKKFTSLSLTRYLAELSSKKPIPGGGSASAYAACLGIGLGEMVAQIGLGKATEETKRALLKAIQFFKKARKDALQMVDLDPKVYEAVIKTYAKARKLQDKEKKNRLIDEALENSFRVQANLALLVVMSRDTVRSLETLVHGSIANDLKVSLALLEAAFRGAFDTAQINVVYLKNPEKKTRAEQALEEVKKRFEAEYAGKS